MQNVESVKPAAADPGLAQQLKHVFGFSVFRQNQENIVRAICGSRDVFGVMPTGGGKSLCYQLPAHILPGTCVVISPLISLMKDQVDAACDTGLRAACLNSSMTSREMGSVYRRVHSRAVDLLYVSPERFAMDDFLASLSTVPLCLFAVDEAHCISEWGHDFRPDYLSLSIITRRFPGVPVAAFTATATHRVQDDIVHKLALRDPLLVRASFDRPNLFYQVLPKNGVNDQILGFLRERPGESGIVYRTSRSSVEDTAAALAGRGIKALPYHAGMDAAARTRNQEMFNRDDAQVMVATIAFGMGIDKSNIRFVVHADLPKNMEGYYQETGRAGRDGEPAHCLLLFGRGDILKIRYFIGRMTDEKERRIALDKLSQMADYAGFTVCRRRQILNYFGECYAKKNCGTCDICADHVERVDVTREAQMVMSAMVRTEQRYGAKHIVNIVTGTANQKLTALGHDTIQTFGVGRDRPARFWMGFVDELIARECIGREGEPYPALKLFPKGVEILRGKRIFTMLKREESVRRRRIDAFEDYDETLFERLKILRKSIADARNMPAFVVFSDTTLHDMCRIFPTSFSEMLEVAGVGKKKLEQYGRRFIAEVRQYVQKSP